MTEFMLNGEAVSLESEPAQGSVLSLLRRRGYVGTKEGCAEGDCGACTVALIGRDADGQPCYQAINSCLLPVGSVLGRDVITVEGVSPQDPFAVLESAEMHPVQARMVELGGSQCGYCTPGFIMSLFCSYYSGDKSDTALEGNLCRCTGYVPIRKALRSLDIPQEDDVFKRRLQLDLTHLNSVQDVGYERPTHLTEALEILQAQPETRLIAGGTDLMLEMHLTGKTSPLLSLEAVADLQTIDDTPSALIIGACAPLTHVQTRTHGVLPALDKMLRYFASKQIRNRATLGGNIANASPIGDLPIVLLAWDAVLELASSQHVRTISLSEFFLGYRQTALQPDEIITHIHIPKTLPSEAVKRYSMSYKVGKRGTDDISTVASCYTVDVDEAGTIIQARLAYGGVAATPVRANEVEAALIGQPWSLNTVKQAKAQLMSSFSPISDFRGSALYRRQLIGNLFEKFYHEAVEGTYLPFTKDTYNEDHNS